MVTTDKQSLLKIGILGSGTVAKTLADIWRNLGHEVCLGTRDPEKADIAEWVKQRPGIRMGTFESAAKFGDVVFLSVLGRVAESALELAGPENLSGKTIIDTTNPISDEPPENGVLRYFTGPNESLGERVQAKVPAANVVKAFNSVGSVVFAHPKFSGQTGTMFICGNNESAKEQASTLIREVGWELYDCGAITSARALEGLCILWCSRGFQDKGWTHAFKLLTE